MPRGQADFGIYAVKETVSGLADLGELAARLGSIVTFDRRGDVIWLDDFESAINKWLYDGSGNDWSVAISALSARNGGFSVKLTTGDSQDSVAHINRHLPYPVLSRIGLEVSFTLDSLLKDVDFQLNLYDGSKTYPAHIRYRIGFDDLSYLDNTGVYQVFATNVPLGSSIEWFHTLKLVVDFFTKKYIRCILNEVTYDLSAYSLQSDTSFISPCLWVWIQGTTDIDANKSFYVDDVILTQEEP